MALLYEEEHLLALDKPAGLVVHPTGRYRDGTLVNALAWHLAEGGEGAAAASAAAGATPPGRETLAGTEPPAVGPGLVHRLDRDTSGVLLVAKSPARPAAPARAIT